MIAQEKEICNKGSLTKVEKLTGRNLSALLACPLAIACFRHPSCFDFCEMVEKHPVPLTPVEKEVVNEREIWLERVNINLEGLLKKANRDKNMLCHMKHHYWARMHVGNAKMKILQRRLSQELKRRKKSDPLRVLAEVSLAKHDT